MEWRRRSELSLAPHADDVGVNVRTSGAVSKVDGPICRKSTSRRRSAAEAPGEGTPYWPLKAGAFGAWRVLPNRANPEVKFTFATFGIGGSMDVFGDLHLPLHALCS